MTERIFAAASALLLVLAATPAASGQQTATLEDFSGRYVFQDGEDRLLEAIDCAVAELGLLIREIARHEIRRNLRPERRVVVEVVDDTQIRLTLGEWGPLDLRLDGRERRVRGPDGSDTRIRARFVGGKIELQQDSPRGRRENWLSLASGGQYLFLQVRVRAEQLPQPVRYTLTYRRRGGA